MIDYREDTKWTVYVHIVPKAISGYDWDKYYVGITSKKTEERWGKNGHGYHHQKYWYGAIKKYDWNKIIHEVIASNLTKSEACALEQQLINKLNSNNRKYGYNLTKGGEGVIANEETKMLISLHHADFSGGNSGKSKTVYCFTENGIFIKKYEALSLVEKELKINRHTIKNSSKYKRSYYGYRFGYESDVYEKNGEYYLLDSSNHPKPTTSKKVFQFSLDKNYINQYPSCVVAGRENQMSKRSISQAAIGKTKTAYGYIWKYEKDVIKKDNTFFIA